MKRAGHTEATVDLCRLAGKYPSGVLCEIVTSDKSDMARLPELEAFAQQHHLPIVSIADLIRYRSHSEKLVRRIAEASLPTEFGQFQAYVFESVLNGEQHMALVYGGHCQHLRRARARALGVSHRRRVHVDAL